MRGGGNPFISLSTILAPQSKVFKIDFKMKQNGIYVKWPFLVFWHSLANAYNWILCTSWIIWSIDQLEYLLRESRAIQVWSLTTKLKETALLLPTQIMTFIVWERDTIRDLCTIKIIDCTEDQIFRYMDHRKICKDSLLMYIETQNTVLQNVKQDLIELCVVQQDPAIYIYLNYAA